MRRKTILVVDDYALVRLALAEYFSEFGFSVVMAEDGAEALASLDRYTPDLVITDYSMPRLDGRALMAAIQTRLPDVPVILMSGDRDQLEQQAGITIKKPFDFGVLHTMVSEILDSPPD